MLVLEQNQKENQIKLVNHMATFVWQTDRQADFTDRTDSQTAGRETEDNVQAPLIVACCVFFAYLSGTRLGRAVSSKCAPDK